MQQLKIYYNIFVHVKTIYYLCVQSKKKNHGQRRFNTIY